MKKVGFFSKKVPASVVLAFGLVIILAFGVFGIFSNKLYNEKKLVTYNLSKAEADINSLTENNASKDKLLSELSGKVAEYSNTLSGINQTVSDLQSQVNSLKKQNEALSSAIKVKEKALKNPTSVKVGEVLKNISLTNLTAPNDGYKVCYLTFDDGPSDNTLKILNILKTANAKATFFVVGTGKIEYLSQIESGGHTVALHTNTHEWEIYKTEDTYYSDLNAIRETVNSAIGKEVNLIRFPGGSSNKKSATFNKGIMTRLTKDVCEKGFIYFDWNVDSGDAAAQNVPAQNIVANIMNESKNKEELCILMHDTSSKNTTVEALPYVICYLRAQGYRFEALSEKSNTFHHENLHN